LLISFSQRPIFIYLLNAYGYFTPGITTMFLLGIFWRRATRAGALTAAILAIPLSLGLDWLMPILGFGQLSFMNRTGLVFWICMLAAVLVSLFTEPVPEDRLKGLIWNCESIYLPKDLRTSFFSFKSPVIWWAIINALVIYFYIRYY
jgi:solute:Na+ symporter, SSS family